MKALTIYQPWAQLIAMREKKIETRSWVTNYRGPLAIHAGKNNKYESLSFQEPFYSSLFKEASGYTYPIEYGCVVAVGNLVDCSEIPNRFGYPSRQKVILANGRHVHGNEYIFGDYSPGRYAWILSDVKILPEPIPAKGRQGLWNWEPPDQLF